MADVVDVVRKRCRHVPPFEVIIDPPQVWRTGIVCAIRPGARMRRLWEVTIEAGRQVTGERFEVRPDPYAPHLTLAYPTGHVDDRPLRVWLSDCALGPITLPITTLSLVAEQHDRRAITWRPHTDVTLGQG